MELRETRALPRGLAPEALEPFARALAARLAPGLEDHLTVVRCDHEAAELSDFQAHAELDGALIVLDIAPRDGTLRLLVDDAAPPEPVDVGRWTYLAVAGVVTTGYLVHEWSKSVVLGVLAAVVVLFGWIALGLARGRRKLEARRGCLDVDGWRFRLDEALEHVTTSHLAARCG